MPEEQDWSYVELQSTEDNVDQVAGETINLSAKDYACSDSDVSIKNNTLGTYPDLVFHYPVQDVVINGNPAEVKVLIGGHHPPPRPK